MIVPEWVDVTRMGSPFEEQLDVRARRGSPNEYRHRRRAFTGESEAQWIPGPAPRPAT